LISKGNILLLIIFLFIPLSAFTQQIGGQQLFSFLKLPTTARINSLGGINVSLREGNDVNMMVGNPALLNKDHSGIASVNYIPLFGAIKQSMLSYAHDFKKTGIIGANLQYINYGTLDETDINGNIIGSFHVSEYAFSIVHSRTVNYFTLGAGVKLAGSNIANYSAYGLLFDVGGLFKHPEKDFTVGVSIKNFGFILKNYTVGSNTTLPFDVQIGTSFKPKRMPLRFSFTAQKLTAFDIAYNDPTQNFQLDANGKPIQKNISFADKFFRHFVFGAEIILSKNFQLRAGYNYLIRRELKLENTSGGAGFSFGAMIKVKTWEVAYSRQWYHVAGGTNCLTIIADLKTLSK